MEVSSQLSRSGRFTPREIAAGAHWIGWGGGQSRCEEKNSQPQPGLEIPIIHPVA
jgi:hypothetical protein